MNIYFTLIFSLFIIINAKEDHCSSSYCSVLDYQDDVDWTEHISDLWAWMSAQKSKNVVTFCNNDKSTFSPTDFTHSPIKGKNILFNKCLKIIEKVSFLTLRAKRATLRLYCWWIKVI